MDYGAYATELINYIDKSPCAAWACKNAADMLEAAGFEELDGRAEAGKRCYISCGTHIAAFIKGGSEVRIGAAHLDSPAVMIKPRCNLVSEGAYVRLDSEIYGGAILSSWLDRPLGIAGRIMLASGGLIPEARLYKSDRALCIIPNCAPHLNRDINNGYVYNKQKDMLPLFSLDPKADLLKTVAEDIGAARDDIIDYELYCYDICGGMTLGENGDMISSGRLDDLMMSYAMLRALCDSDTANTAVVILTDNEEVGSLTRGGAGGCFAERVMRAALGDDFKEALGGCTALSADMAHAVNPSHPELHEPLSRPYINRGIVLKRAASMSYSTDGMSGAFFKLLCREAGVPYQEFVNRSDKPGGRTIGPMLSAALGIPTADIGAPIMAMHSVRELGGIRDAGDSYILFKKYFEI